MVTSFQAYQARLTSFPRTKIFQPARWVVSTLLLIIMFVGKLLLSVSTGSSEVSAKLSKDV